MSSCLSLTRGDVLISGFDLTGRFMRRESSFF